MPPTLDDIKKLHIKYSPNKPVFNLVYQHCEIVANIAKWCSGNVDVKVDWKLLQAACLLHDIGTYAFFNKKGETTNEQLYPQHAILGAKILIDEGVDQKIANIVETHILLGLTKKEIIDRPWPLPARDYEPTT